MRSTSFRVWAAVLATVAMSNALPYPHDSGISTNIQTSYWQDRARRATEATSTDDAFNRTLTAICNKQASTLQTDCSCFNNFGLISYSQNNTVNEWYIEHHFGLDQRSLCSNPCKQEDLLREFLENCFATLALVGSSSDVTETIYVPAPFNSVAVIKVEGNFAPNYLQQILAQFTSLNAIRILDNNDIHDIDISVLIPNTTSAHDLSYFELHNVHLTGTITSNTFSRLKGLKYLLLENVGLTSLSEDVFSSITGLTALSLMENSLQSIPHSVFDSLKQVSVLKLNSNALTSLDVNDFRDLSLLRILHLHNNRLAVLPDNIFSNNANLSQLDVSGNMLSSFPVSVLSPSSHIKVLNVSSNPNLVVDPNLWSSSRSSSLTALSISNTQTQPSPDLCEENDQLTSLFSVNVGLSSIRSKTAHQKFVQQCFGKLHYLDVSDNNIVDLLWLNQVHDEYIYPLRVDKDDQALADIALTNVEFAGNPAYCRLEPRIVRRHLSSYEFLTFDLPSLQRVCYCQSGYTERAGICQSIEDKTWMDNPGYFAAFTLAMIVVGMMLFILLGKFVRWNRKMRKDNIIFKSLLEESHDEIDQLKRAWEIGPEELQLVDRIDRDSPGTYGEVWKGTWNGVPVAVKRLKAAPGMRSPYETVTLGNMSSTDSEFEKEVEFMRTCRHRNVLRFFGAGYMDGLPFMVLELAVKGALRTYLRQAAKPSSSLELSNDNKYLFAHDIAVGMQHIHSLGVTHRDLKTANVLICVVRREIAKIADFGTIKNLLLQRSAIKNNTSVVNDQQVTDLQMSMTSCIGTPLYMAPEIIEGNTYDQHADVFSFGVVLWELMSQKDPDLLAYLGIRGGPLMANLLKNLKQDKRLPVFDSWPTWYSQLVSKCWLTDYKQRPSFEDIIAILGEHTSGNSAILEGNQLQSGSLVGCTEF